VCGACPSTRRCWPRPSPTLLGSLQPPPGAEKWRSGAPGRFLPLFILLLLIAAIGIHLCLATCLLPLRDQLSKIKIAQSFFNQLILFTKVPNLIHQVKLVHYFDVNWIQIDFVGIQILHPRFIWIQIRLRSRTGSENFRIVIWLKFVK